MIEQWNRTITYESYFNACQPTQCTYSYTSRNDIIYILTTFFGLTGGLITILKFISPFIVKLEKRVYERKISELEEELKKIDSIKADNIRLKEENAALIRVISKLSK
ncbi:unnamed protein product [Rotaria sp. Silwood1]|nr:unnamed protein product [Rotaria sp. Silwood1]